MAHRDMDARRSIRKIAGSAQSLWLAFRLWARDDNSQCEYKRLVQSQRRADDVRAWLMMKVEPPRFK